MRRTFGGVEELAAAVAGEAPSKLKEIAVARRMRRFIKGVKRRGSDEMRLATKRHENGEAAFINHRLSQINTDL